jgi:delta1-piperideine-2-carboxylate reductase
MSDQPLRVPLPEVTRVLAAALRAAGCDAANAAAVARVTADAERDGCSAHGVFRLPGYLAALRSGKVDGTARPATTRIAPGVIRVDGQGGFAPLAMQEAAEAIGPVAREQGIAAAAVVNVHHFSALWADIEGLVQSGLVAFCFTSYMPAVAPAGARKPFFGTNPMAFGWPRPAGGAMIWDQASAAMARGEVAIAARDGHALPPGTGIDADGNPTTDPAAVLKGAILPFGGHKGSAIAMMVELLAGALIGQPFSVEAAERDNRDGGPPRGGVLLLAIDPARFGDEAGWQAHAESFFGRLTALEGVRLPGDRRTANRARIAAQGVTLPPKLWAEATAAAGEAP